MTECNETNLDLKDNHHSRNIIHERNGVHEFQSSEVASVNSYDVELLNINKKGNFILD